MSADELLRESLQTRLAPVGAIECLYVGRIIAATWRLQRALAAEQRIFKQWGRNMKCPEDLNAHEFVGKESDRVQRHIAVLERSLDKSLALLDMLQARRRDAGEDDVPEQPAPSPVDVTNSAIVENEPNSSDEPDAMAHSGAREGDDVTDSSSAKIEIVKTNPIPVDQNESIEPAREAVEEGEQPCDQRSKPDWVRAEVRKFLLS